MFETFIKCFGREEVLWAVEEELESVWYNETRQDIAHLCAYAGLIDVILDVLIP